MCYAVTCGSLMVLLSRCGDTTSCRTGIGAGHGLLAHCWHMRMSCAHARLFYILLISVGSLCRSGGVRVHTHLSLKMAPPRRPAVAASALGASVPGSRSQPLAAPRSASWELTSAQLAVLGPQVHLQQQGVNENDTLEPMPLLSSPELAELSDERSQDRRWSMEALQRRRRRRFGVKASRAHRVAHCSICRGVGHNKRSCPLRVSPLTGARVCLRCGQPGHTSRPCKMKARFRQLSCVLCGERGHSYHICPCNPCAPAERQRRELLSQAEHVARPFTNEHRRKLRAGRAQYIAEIPAHMRRPRCSVCGVIGHRMSGCPHAEQLLPRRCSMCRKSGHNRCTCGKDPVEYQEEVRLRNVAHARASTLRRFGPRKHDVNACSRCGEPGHNAKSCPWRPDSMTLLEQAEGAPLPLQPLHTVSTAQEAVVWALQQLGGYATRGQLADTLMATPALRSRAAFVKWMRYAAAHTSVLRQ